MPNNLLRAASHQQTEMASVEGPQSYDTGGFSVRSDLGRVDEVMVQAGEDDSGEKPFDATATVADDNVIVVKAHSQGTSTGVEAAQDTDLSAISFTYQAARL